MLFDKKVSLKKILLIGLISSVLIPLTNLGSDDEIGSTKELMNEYFRLKKANNDLMSANDNLKKDKELLQMSKTSAGYKELMDDYTAVSDELQQVTLKLKKAATEQNLELKRAHDKITALEKEITSSKSVIDTVNNKLEAYQQAEEVFTRKIER
jgi:hypothetical protein